MHTLEESPKSTVKTWLDPSNLYQGYKWTHDQQNLSIKKCYRKSFKEKENYNAWRSGSIQQNESTRIVINAGNFFSTSHMHKKLHKFSALKLHPFIISCIHRSGVWMQVSWVLCPWYYQTKTNVQGLSPSVCLAIGLGTLSSWRLLWGPGHLAPP